MSLAPGTRVGPYAIAAPLGAGGMGEVYAARDHSLNRNVAIKILPAAFATDPDRLARFRREAHTLAQLNHPHIAHVYGFEDSGGVKALVMELTGAGMARYCGDGRLLYTRGPGLFSVGFDPERLTTSGTPAQVVPAVARDPSTGAAHFACSRDGMLAFVPATSAGAATTETRPLPDSCSCGRLRPPLLSAPCGWSSAGCSTSRTARRGD